MKKKIVAVILCMACLMSACKKEEKKRRNRVDFEIPSFQDQLDNDGKISASEIADQAQIMGELVHTNERGNLSINEITKICDDFDERSWNPYIIGSTIYFTFEYQAGNETELSMVLLPAKDDFVWDKDDILTVTKTKMEKTEGYIGVEVGMDIPDNLKLGNYVVAFMEEDRVEGVTVLNFVDKEHSEPMTAKKPVIYLYPEQEMEVRVELQLSGELGCTYPSYGNGWTVLAHPDGSLTNLSDGRNYDYLFWEGRLDMEPCDFSSAACVKGEDTAAFLEKYLEEAGLNASEIDDFISYWLPQMENHEYNLITFSTSSYEDAAKLNIYPKPDSELRIFMTFKEISEPVDSCMTSPKPFSREGFTVVEWGGCEVK